MKKTRVLYVLMEFPNLDIEQEMEEEMYIAPFIVGVFSKKSLAMDAAEELYVKNKGRYLYLIEDYALNEMYFKDEEEIEREISEHLEEMVKEGVVDYKIGEDGNFYFEVVEDKKDKKNE